MSDTQRLIQLFKESGLPSPQLPGDLGHRLREIEAWHFTTNPSINIMDDPWLIVEQLRRAPEDYFAVRHGGHGLAIYALRYYVAYGPLALFLIMPWGNVYATHDADQRTSEALNLAGKLLAQTTNITERYGVFVFASDMYASWWQMPGDSEPRKCEGGQVEVLRDVLTGLNM